VTKAKRIDAKDRAMTRNLLPLVALGGGLAATPAAALELGDVSVQSNLGQPLRASIAYALAPNEMLSSTCVSVSTGQSTGGLPGIGKSTVNITERAIVITGQAAVREPMLGARVTINCPYTPNLSREYMLFVDPAPVAAALRAAPPVARPETTPAVTAVAETRPASRAPVNNTPIGQSTEYQVQRGDTLSDIVRRIENRTMQLWPAVNAIFAANPDAFIGNDPNRLKAGAWLTIPSLDGTAPVVSASAEPAATERVAPATTDSAPSGVYEPGVAAETAVTDAAAEPLISTDTAAETPQEAVADSTADLKPGDVVYDYDLVESTETVVIPDTEVEGPQTTAETPNVPTAVISTGARTESTSLLAWLLGGALVIVGGLVLFGRRWRKGSGSTPFAAAATVHSSADDTVEAAADYDIDDDSPTEENLALDADLVLGTGLDEGVEMDVAEADFGFAATTDLDIELPFEPEAPASGDTDIIPPSQMNVESILESEVLPEDDDYDMSVIVDATKMPQPEEVTERDLKAVAVEASDETLITDSYTVSREVDYDILEQDYEDEMTATQALNQEIERAAAEIAAEFGETDTDATSALPASTVAELDATAELPVREDTDKTAEFEASYDPNDTNAVTVNMSHEDKTAEMPVANDEDTAEMEVESGTVDTKRLG
jgi:murein DD-endopeptidase MepM/ murein hydrolase activator NlpD